MIDKKMSPLEELAWTQFGTVIVYGRIRRAVWWPPARGMPGVLAARDEGQARAMLEEVQKR